MQVTLFQKVKAAVLLVAFISACVTVETALYLADVRKGKSK